MSQISSSKKATPIVFQQLQRSSQFHASQIAAPRSSKGEITSIKTSIDRGIFLKTKPQVLIMMQQAQIQRLTSYLNDYKCKYNQMNRQKLDRQSYQMQIKQLFQKQGYNSSQIYKLNRTIQNLINGNESFRSQLFAASEQKHDLIIGNKQLLQRNAELLKQVQFITNNRLQQRKKAEQQKGILKTQISSLRQYIKSLEQSNSTLFKQAKQAYQQLSKSHELQAHIKHSSQYIKTLNKQIQLKSSNLINKSKDHDELLRSYHIINQSRSKILSEAELNKEIIQKLNFQNQELMRVKQICQGQLKNVKEMYERESVLMENQISDMLIVRKLNEGELASKQRQIRQLQQKCNIYTQKLKISNLNCVKISQQKYQIQRQRVGLHYAVTNLQQNLSSSLKQLSFMKTQLTTKTTQLQTSKSLLQTAKTDLQKLKKIQSDLTDQKAKNEKQLNQLSKIISNKIKQNQKLKVQLISQEQQMIQRFQQNLTQYTETYDKKIQKITNDQQNLDLINKKLSEQKQKLIQLLKTMASDSTEVKKSSQKLLSQNVQLIKKRDELLSQRNELKQGTKTLQKQIQNQIIKLSEGNQTKQNVSVLLGQKKLLQIQCQKRNNMIQILQKSKIQMNQKIESQNTQNNELLNNLTKKLTQIQNYKKYIDQMNQQKAKLFQTIAYFRHQIIQIQTLMSEQINKQNNYKQQFKKQIAQKDTQNAQIIQQINKLKQQKSKNSIKITELQTKIHNLTIAKNSISSDNQKLKSTQKQLIQQRATLSLLLQIKTKQSQKLKAKLIQLEIELRTSYDQFLKQKQVKFLSQLKIKDQQKQQLSKTILRLNDQSAKFKQNQQNKHKQLLRSLNQMRGESSKEKIFRQSLKKEYDLLKISYNSVEQKLKMAQNNNYIRLQQNQIEKNTLKKLLQQKNRNVTELKLLIEFYQQNIDLLSKEVDRLQKIIVKNNKQFKSQMDNIKNANNDFYKNSRLQKAQIQTKRLKITELQQYNRVISTKMTRYQDIINKLKQQFASLQLTTTQLQNQRDYLENKNNNLLKSVKRFSQELLSTEIQSTQKITLSKQLQVKEQLNKRYARIYNILNTLERSEIEYTQNTVIQNRRIISQ